MEAEGEETDVIRSFDYLKSLPEIEQQLVEAFARVMHSGNLILGPETQAFEREFASFVGARFCVGVSSGTAALHLALMALGVGPGDEVITVANTCVPTVAAIRLTGADPVFVDVREYDLTMDPNALAGVVGERTRCMVPVHLWGQSADMHPIIETARRHRLNVVEDCAQAHGTRYRGRHVGTFGDAGCFSFYPTKNLGALGDAGAVVTEDSRLAEKLMSLRQYGYDEARVSQAEGLNARISEVQAAILRVKLRHLPEWLVRRREVSALYDCSINNPAVRLPVRPDGTEASFHQYVIRCADRARITAALEVDSIGFAVHYPVPVSHMPAYRATRTGPGRLPVTERASGEVLSIPIHEALSRAEALEVTRVLNAAR